MNLLCSWSGGKDSCFALMQMAQKPSVLLNVLNEGGQISRSHGLSREVLRAQANAIGVPIHFFSTTWADYTEKYIKNLQNLTSNHLLTDAVFGDIDIEVHREWEQNVCNAAKLSCHLPLWQINRKALVLSMIEAGVKAVIVSCNDTLGKDFLGKIIDEATLAELEEAGVDVCGENGEYHTLVIDCPIFCKPLDILLGEKRNNGTGYNFIDISIK
ncbi:MAG: diphthine--ammonia ligase [Emticicia sp.]|nr:diphthine--ammonia ligase [Emticicia sp.]